MMSLLKRFLADENGATAIEYGLIAIGISLAIAAATPAIGGSLGGIFAQIAGYL